MSYITSKPFIVSFRIYVHNSNKELKLYHTVKRLSNKRNITDVFFDLLHLRNHTVNKATTSKLGSRHRCVHSLDDVIVNPIKSKS